MPLTYPHYVYYPRWHAAPEWLPSLIQAFASQQSSLDTAQVANKSDVALQCLRPGLETLGFQVESSKQHSGKLFRPVFFGENGAIERQYQIDAYQPEWRVALEIEAGRSTQGNAIYRDLVQMSLLVDVDYAAVAVPLAYRYQSAGKPQLNEAYQLCKSILEAIYSGRRLQLPFQGFLLIGY